MTIVNPTSPIAAIPLTSVQIRAAILAAALKNMFKVAPNHG